MNSYFALQLNYFERENLTKPIKIAIVSLLLITPLCFFPDSTWHLRQAAFRDSPLALRCPSSVSGRPRHTPPSITAPRAPPRCFLPPHLCPREMTRTRTMSLFTWCPQHLARGQSLENVYWAALNFKITWLWKCSLHSHITHYFKCLRYINNVIFQWYQRLASERKSESFFFQAYTNWLT